MTTITDICAAANVGRSTFYAHFTSKDDLKRSGLNDLRIRLLDLQHRALASPQQPPFSLSLPLFQHARDHHDLYRALAGTHGGAIGVAMIRQMVTDLVRKELITRAHGLDFDASPPEAIVQFLVGAFMALLTWWLNRGAKISVDEIDQVFRRLASSGLGQPARARSLPKQ